jgi:hypothetical protein
VRDCHRGAGFPAGGLIRTTDIRLHKDNVAQSAYDIADAMLIERSKA